jgi:signal transduction histidine kinase
VGLRGWGGVEGGRSGIATDLHDDIGASLSRIAILSEVVKQTAAGADSESRTRLSEIADSARGLIDAMSDIVWAVDPRKDRLDDLARRVNGFASDVLEAQGIRFRPASSAQLDGVRLEPEERRHLLLIAKEAIHNAVRHSGAREVFAELAVAGRELRLTIGDDGGGFDPDAVASAEHRRRHGRGGHGLPSLAARASELGGTLAVDSAPGRGTRLTVRVPLGRRMVMR